MVSRNLISQCNTCTHVKSEGHLQNISMTMKMPRAYPTWSRMWMIPNFFSYLEWKKNGDLPHCFVEGETLCWIWFLLPVWKRLWNRSNISFPGNYDWLFRFWVLCREYLNVWMNRGFASTKKKKVKILKKKPKNYLFELKNPIIITLLCSDGLSAARRAQLTFTTEKVPTFLLTDFHELFWSFSYYITWNKRFTAFAPR